jgi:hypothetical protein
MRAVGAAIVVVFCWLALSQLVSAVYCAAPSGDAVNDRTPHLHEKAVVNVAESKVSESEETDVLDCQLASQPEFFLPLAPPYSGVRQHASPRDLLRTLHRLRI